MSTSTQTGRMNRAGLEIIKAFEGLRQTAYRDAVGVWTIGWGHTGPDVRPGMAITRSKADKLLRQDLRRFEVGVQRLVRVPLTSNQFSALVSFSFNVGLGAFGKSTMLRLLNQRNYNGAAAQFDRWVKAGGRVLRGLVRRRRAERALFLAGDSLGDWFCSATAAQLEPIIRKVLNEGTAFGQRNWAGTSKTTLKGIQQLANLLALQVVSRLPEAVAPQDGPPSAGTDVTG